MQERFRRQVERHPHAITAGVIGGALVLSLLAVGLAFAVFSGAPPTADVSPVPSASADLSVRPSASPSVSPAMASSAATPVPPGRGFVEELVVPSFVSVIADALQVRQAPGLSGEPLLDSYSCIDNPYPNCGRPILVGTETPNVDLYLVDGPVEVEGYVWYLVATEGPAVLGWVAAGDDADSWLVSAARSCPSQPLELADVTVLSTSRLLLLHCFSGQAMTFRGWYPALPPGEQETSLEQCQAERAWLLCNSVFQILRLEPGNWAGNADYLAFVIDPAAGISMPARSQWVEVTGAFDHPSAGTCGDAGVVLHCRTIFAVSSAVAP